MAERKDTDANVDVHASDAAVTPRSSATGAKTGAKAGAQGEPQTPSNSASAADARNPGQFLPIIYEGAAWGAGAGDAGIAGNTEARDSAEASRWSLIAYLPIAATIAVAAAVGVMAGAATTAGLLRDDTAPVALATSQALQNSVEKLGAELAALKAGLNTAQRSANTNFGKLAERLDRTEKAQAEPAAKLAKLTESVDKLDRRVAHASTHASTYAAADITGSVPVPAAKPESQPVLAEGWRLRDFYAGRAVVQNRVGTLFEVGPGSNLPGLGRVETIKREDGRIVVVTRNGIITASLERRREPYPLPYRY